MTDYILPLLFGFLSASFGTVFPGLINMTAAKVRLNDGKERALLFVFVIAKKPKRKKKNIDTRSKSNRFFYGMLLAGLNFFPIPFYVFVTITLSVYKVFSFNFIPIASFLVGVLLGSFSIFYFYISYFIKMEKKADFLFNNINKIIGTITAVISIISIINIIKYYF